MLGQSHCDALPLMSQQRAQAPFPPTAGRALTVVACTKHGARWRQKLRLSLVYDRLNLRALVVGEE